MTRISTCPKVLSVPCTKNAIDKIDKFFEEVVATGPKIPEDKLYDIKLSLYEGVTNAIKHGNKHNTKKDILVIIWHNSETFRIMIKDQGAGFDVRHKLKRCPLEQEHLTQCGGRGLYLMNLLSNRLSYSNHGTKLNMYFNLVDKDKNTKISDKKEHDTPNWHPAIQPS